VIEGNGNAPDPNIVTLIIQFDQRAQTTQVQGPLTNRPLCNLMLEEARCVVQEFDFNRRQQAAIVPVTSLPNLSRG